MPLIPFIKIDAVLKRSSIFSNSPKHCFLKARLETCFSCRSIFKPEFLTVKTDLAPVEVNQPRTHADKSCIMNTKHFRHRGVFKYMCCVHYEVAGTKSASKTMKSLWTNIKLHRNGCSSPTQIMIHAIHNLFGCFSKPVSTYILSLKPLF